ncbi:hypothetical protein HDU96_001310 [Phlyctochytrium bullatum]|nr:hypothetical protein HDU96_001310 [Phlyctochytrium bullatum]
MDSVCDLVVKSPGVFEYYIEYRPSGMQDEYVKSKVSGSVVVDPRLYLPSTSVMGDGQPGSDILLPLDGICILTVVPKIAYELDEALMNMSADLEEAGVSVEINSEESLQAAMGVFRGKVIPKLKLWEFYVIDAKGAKEEFLAAWRGPRPAWNAHPEHKRFLNVNLAAGSVKDRGDFLRKEALYVKKRGHRFGKALKLDVAVAFMLKLLNDLGEGAPREEAGQVALFEQTVDEVNLPFYQECDSDVSAISDNVTNRTRYLRVDGHGPKLGPVSKQLTAAETKTSAQIGTHDNETPHQKRTAEDTLPTAALVAMSNCAIGSVKGFDEVVPELLNVVTETRKYRIAEPYEGIIPAVHIIESAGLRVQVQTPGHASTPYIHHDESGDELVVPTTPTQLYQTMGIHPADADAIKQSRDRRAHLRGRKTLGVIAGLPCYLDFSSVLTTLTHTKQHAVGEENGRAAGMQTSITMDPAHFLPGSIVVYRTWMVGSGMDIEPVVESFSSPALNPGVLSPTPEKGTLSLSIPFIPPRSPTPEIRGRDKTLTASEEQEGEVERLWRYIGLSRRNFGIELMILMGRDVLESAQLAVVSNPKTWPLGLWEAIQGLGVEEINVALFRCGAEELDTIGDNVYDIPGHGAIPYCGFQGFISVLQPVARNNDLGHPICARDHLVAFGSTLKHGLIPNLLDQAVFPRYNARDAAWWWLWGVQQYCLISPEGNAFLGQQVPRRFPPRRRYRKGEDYLKVAEEVDEQGNGLQDAFSASEDRTKTYAYTSTIAELCHEIMERHARGSLRFKEWNAGPRLDHAMTDAGFEIAVAARFDGNGGGLVFGGNRFNCGTWMDKMGDSDKAGTKGVPATPRDGAAVEIIGLLKAALRWITTDVLTSDVGKNLWPATGVVIREGQAERTITYQQWNDILGKSFEKFFYIPQDPMQQLSYAIDRPELVNRRGIYKDTVGASQAFADYQFRPNFCVAMVVAPELFNPDHARGALELAKEVLLGPLGMKTLDPSDWSYRGYYDNGNDSNDPALAHGFNYHQGPEWVWVMGFFLRAYLHFNVIAPGANPAKKREVIHWVQQVLMKHKLHAADVGKNPFAGLPELTNANGEFCPGSCPTQAWSCATLLETVHDMYSIVDGVDAATIANGRK